MKTPEILYGAIRQYRHNRGNDELVMGFDSDETIKAVTKLQAEIQHLRDLLAKSIRREEIIAAGNKRLRSALEELQNLCGGSIKIQPQYDVATEALNGSEEGGVCEWGTIEGHGDKRQIGCKDEYAYFQSRMKFCYNCGKPIRLVQEEELNK